MLQSNLLWWRRYQARAHLLGLKLKVCDRASAQNTRTPAIASQNVVSLKSVEGNTHTTSARGLPAIACLFYLYTIQPC